MEPPPAGEGGGRRGHPCAAPPVLLSSQPGSPQPVQGWLHGSPSTTSTRPRPGSSSSCATNTFDSKHRTVAASPLKLRRPPKSLGRGHRHGDGPRQRWGLPSSLAPSCCLPGSSIQQPAQAHLSSPGCTMCTPGSNGSCRYLSHKSARAAMAAPTDAGSDGRRRLAAAAAVAAAAVAAAVVFRGTHLGSDTSWGLITGEANSFQETGRALARCGISSGCCTPRQALPTRSHSQTRSGASGACV